MTVDEKRGALEQLLESRVLRRCEQLKKMLRFICEAEFEGRAEELNEYLIGVEALGREPSYNPVEDSIVRTRAYELRNKLTKYYATEAPDSPVRIEIQRGAYIPRFIRIADPPRDPISSALAPVPSLAPPVLLAPPAIQPAPRRPGRRWERPALAIACCVIVALATLLFLTWPRRANGPQEAANWTADMASFWTPFLADDTPLMLAYDSRLFLTSPEVDLIVRDYRVNQMSDVPNSRPLMRLQELTGSKAFHETRNYVDFGSIYSVFLLMRTVARRQDRMVLKPAQDLDWNDIFNNNLILLGRAANQPRLGKFLGGDFVEQVGGIRNVKPRPGEREFYPVENPGQNSGEKYALLSRFPVHSPAVTC
jgi:hypothetical protein